MSETPPRWADGELLLPNELERRQIFHILKRDSSLAAWERRLGYYRKWAEVAGESVRQAEEQGLLAKKPYPNSGVIYADDRSSIDYADHKRILDDLTLLEEGVARLGRGDRRVFTFSEHGLFLRARLAADHWSAMYHRFFRSHENAWHEETPLREEFFAALHAYLNTGVESARYICESREQRELRHPAPMRYSLWAIVFLPDLPYPDPLPEVPEPAENRLVETGEIVPYSGIWEPVEDGRIVGTMNYLHGGSPAPLAGRSRRNASDEEHGHDNEDFRAAWRLLWRDDRYEDGVIPEAEKAYRFTPPEKGGVYDDVACLRDHVERHGNPLLEPDTPRVKGGRPCPRSGWWRTSAKYFQEGETLPYFETGNGNPIWRWLEPGAIPETGDPPPRATATTAATTPPRWADGELLLPNELERRQIFYILKRNSSYTAWERRIDYYRKWAEVTKESVRQAEARGLLPDGSKQETSIDRGDCKRIFKDLALFEEGVARLGRGDKRVFTFSDFLTINQRGLFNRACMIMDYWHTAYHKAFHEHEIGWHEETPLTQEFFAALEAFVQTGVGYICEERYQRQLLYPAPMEYSLWAILFLSREEPYPDPLPEVPEPKRNILVKTGRRVPFSGIWEPVAVERGKGWRFWKVEAITRVGTMNYLHGGSPAPLAGRAYRDASDEFYGYDSEDFSALWRLIWRDDRYEDGTIPEEEKTYLFTTLTPPGEKNVYAHDVRGYIEQHGSPLLEPFAPRVEGGSPCTRSGWWLTSGKYFREGKRMPDFETGNAPPIWQWLEPQPEGKQWIIPEPGDGKE